MEADHAGAELLSLVVTDAGCNAIWEFPKVRSTFFGKDPVIRIIVYWGLHWGPPIHGNYHMVISINSGTPIC